MAGPIPGPEIERLIQLLARLPGLGPRSARRAALHLLRKREELLSPLADAMAVSSVLALGGALLARQGAAIGRETYLTCFAVAAGLAVIGMWGASRAGAVHRN